MFSITIIRKLKSNWSERPAHLLESLWSKPQVMPGFRNAQRGDPCTVLPGDCAGTTPWKTQDSKNHCKFRKPHYWWVCKRLKPAFTEMWMITLSSVVQRQGCSESKKRPGMDYVGWKAMVKMKTKENKTKTAFSSKPLLSQAHFSISDTVFPSQSTQRWHQTWMRVSHLKMEDSELRICSGACSAQCGKKIRSLCFSVDSGLHCYAVISSRGW